MARFAGVLEQALSSNDNEKSPRQAPRLEEKASMS
jgi:hypothetical protein